VKFKSRTEENVIETNYRPEETAGYCVRCNRIVARNSQAMCAEVGHAAEMVSGLIELDNNGQPPFQLPRFNWAAAFMPAVWAPAHGAFAGIIVLPLIIFALNALSSALDLPAEAALPFQIITWLITIIILTCTIAFMYHYGTRGWGIAWNKSRLSREPLVTKEMFDQFVKREHLWTILSVISLIGLLYLVISFW